MAQYFDGQSAVSHTVSLTITDQSRPSLLIQGESVSLHWALDRLKLEETPSHTTSGRLSNRDQSEVQLIINRQEYESLRPYLPSRTINFRLLASITLFIGLMAALIFVIIPQLMPWLVDAFPQRWERGLGQTIHQQFVHRHTSCRNEALERSLEQLASHLAGRTLPYEPNVSVIEHSKANAMALPGGYIILHSALIKEADSPEELAGILSHELGHLYYRHSVEHLIFHLGVTGLIDIVTGGGGTLSYIGLSLLTNRYSREHEQQADRYAAEMMTRRGYSLDGMIDFFRRIDLNKGQALQLDDHALEWLSTHPASQKRIAFLESYPGPDTIQPVMSTADWEKLQRLKGCGFNRN